MIKELIVLSCCDNPTERGYFCQMITYRTSSIHQCCMLLKFESYNLVKKFWLIKVLIFM